VRCYHDEFISPTSADIDEKLLGHRAGPRLRESRLIMSTREVLTNFVLGFVAAGLGSFMVYPLDAVCWDGPRMPHVCLLSLKT
jgi:hypothetical protein